MSAADAMVTVSGGIFIKTGVTATLPGPESHPITGEHTTSPVNPQVILPGCSIVMVCMYGPRGLEGGLNDTCY